MTNLMGKWFISQNEENFSGVCFDSRDEAIAEGRELYDGEPFFVGKADHSSFETCGIVPRGRGGDRDGKTDHESDRVTAAQLSALRVSGVEGSQESTDESECQSRAAASSAADSNHPQRRARL